MNTKLYVANLPYSITEAALRAAFDPYGSVVQIAIMYDRDTGRTRGFAFVTLGTPEEAKAAVDGLSGTDLGGRTIRVSEAKPQTTSSPAATGRERHFGPDRKAGAFGARYRDRR